MNYPRNFPGTNVDKSSGFFLGNTDFVPTLWTSKGPPCHKKGGGGGYSTSMHMERFKGITEGFLF